MNLIIIDDERTVLDMVIRQLEGISREITYIQTASGAREARMLMEQSYFDIFLCDIVMPNEDGITFAKWVLAKYPDVKFIFLTAHADFGYMKEAISMRSFDYLLQPAEKEELHKVLESAIMQIKIERRNRIVLEKGNFFADYEEDLLEKGALAYLRGDSTDCIYLNRLLTGSSITGKEACYLPVLFQIVKTNRPERSIEKELLREIYRNILNEVLEPLEAPINVMLAEDDTFFCFLRKDTKQQPEFQDLLNRQLKLLLELFEKLLDSALAAYCGEMGSLEEMPQRYGTLDKLMVNNIRRESRIFWERLDNEGQIDHYSFEKQLPVWKKLFEQNRLKEFEQSLFQHMDRYMKKNEVRIEYLVELHQAVSELLLNYQVMCSIDSRDVFDEGLPYLEYMASWKTIDSFKKAVSYCIQRLSEAIGPGDVDVIREAIRYVKENLDRDLSVAEVSGYIGMNPEYFTRLFKKNTGHNLKEFIVSEKINAAKMLLATTHMSVTMIADHVGYVNYSNFIRSFKQIVGCTPLEYRQQINVQSQ